MNNKGQIKPRDIALSFGVFALVISSVVFLMYAIADNNPDAIDDQILATFNNTFNKIEKYEAAGASLESDTRNVAGEEGVFGFLNSLINQAWDTLKGLYTSFTFIAVAISALTPNFGVPGYITTIGGTMLILIFVFGVLSVIFNRDV